MLRFERLVCFSIKTAKDGQKSYTSSRDFISSKISPLLYVLMFVLSEKCIA